MTTKKKSGSSASQAVERQLKRYQSMRDFKVTEEPRGGRALSPSSRTLPFVIQKHAATRLHYDFRLGWNGVLKSWAVTKGPSYYPGDKRLAVQVEDHPMEYGGFEGIIPKGQYGGGTVMVWDFGEWEPHEDVDRGLAEGHLKFELRGKKLKGNWTLVRMHSNAERGDKPGGKPNWLLIKEKDPFARNAEDQAITDEAPDSAVSKRNLDQIAAQEDHVWQSKGKGEKSESLTARATAPLIASKPATNRQPKTASPLQAPGLESAPREKFPGFIPPQLAASEARAPAGDNWVHELKLDGYRIQIHIRAKKARSNERTVILLTRKGLDWSARMPAIAEAASKLAVDDAILDGEVVVLDEKGRSSFADLQAAFQGDKDQYLSYFAFDLLHLNGHNLRELDLLQRKEILENLLQGSDPNSPIRFSEHLQVSGEEVFAQACSLGAEGVISKLATAKYVSGRGEAWLKVKCNQEQELVIGGFTLPSNGGHGIGALLLGYYDGSALRYAGRCGTGFTEQMRKSLRTRLKALTQKSVHFDAVPPDARRGAIWVKPELVAQIAFATWTHDNLVRQASFKGLREDKPAREITREIPKRESETSSGPRKDEAGSKTLKTKSATPRKDTKPMLELAITHPEKILDKESRMTKQALAEYYLAVAERMLPEIANRPLSIVRCPEENDKPCFFQKHVGMGLPKGVGNILVPNRKTSGEEKFITLDSAEGLLGLAQMGVLEIHPWGSHNDSLEQPDRIIFDLDPDAAIGWKTLAASAQGLRSRLKALGLESFLKSTGGKGLHVVVAIEPEHEWKIIKQFAHDLVLQMEKEEPELYITKMAKASRANHIFLDYLRNDRGATAVAPFSPRARRGAPVAVPLDWKELKSQTIPIFHVMNLDEWRGRLAHDPWKALSGSTQRLSTDAIRSLKSKAQTKER